MSRLTGSWIGVLLLLLLSLLLLSGKKYGLVFMALLVAFLMDIFGPVWVVVLVDLVIRSSSLL